MAGAERSVCLVKEFKRGQPSSVVCCERCPSAPLSSGQARLQMELAPVNPSDVNVCEGTYQLLPKEFPAAMGFEGVGKIVEIHKESPGGFEVGDRVFGYNVWGSKGWSGGSWASECVASAAGLRKVPDGVSAEQAASLSINPPTAYGLLQFGGVKLKKGDWVVQNLSSSGVGIAVVQVARILGYNTVNIVRSEEAAQKVRGFGAEHLVVFDEGDVDAPAKAVKAATGGAPIALALNGVGGDSAKLLLKCLAPGGTMLTYGLMGRKPIEIGGGQLIFKDLRVRGFALQRNRGTEEEEEQKWNILLSSAASGALRSVDPAATYPLSQVAEAVEHSFARPGKVMLNCAA